MSKARSYSHTIEQMRCTPPSSFAGEYSGAIRALGVLVLVLLYFTHTRDPFGLGLYRLAMGSKHIACGPGGGSGLYLAGSPRSIRLSL